MNSSLTSWLPTRLSRWLAIGLIVFSSVTSGNCLPPQTATPAGRLSVLANAPVYFEANPGSAGFIARGRAWDVQLTPGEAVLTLDTREETTPRLPNPDAPANENQSAEIRTVRLTLSGANLQGAITGLEPLPGKANYLIGNDPAEWRTGLPLFARVEQNEIYPGIRLIYYANESARLEYDFLLQPGARPEQISLRIAGVDRMQLNAAGDLVLKTGPVEIRQHRPVIYQDVRGVRKEIVGGYRLIGNDAVGFWIRDYDRSLPLVIDPTINLDFLTYLGGSKTETGWGIALDAAGNVYVAGETLSKVLPGTNGVFQPKYAGGMGPFGDAFVAKYDAVSNRLIYLTYLGGKTDDGAFAIAVDPAGNAYVTGFTDSRNFPITNSSIRTVINGLSNNAFRLPPTDAFVAALDPSGSQLLFSTYLGGTRRDTGMGIAVDATGVYVAGYTDSTNFFPIVNAAQGVSGGATDGFVTKLSLDGSTVIYSTYVGGTNIDIARAIAVSSGNAYVTGSTFSTNFPLVNPIVLTNGFTLNRLNGQTKLTTLTDAFVAELANDGSSLVYSTYLGGSNNDAGVSIAVNAAGNAFVTGYTFSRDFPTNVLTLPTSSASNFTAHVFVTEVASGGGSLVYSTAFGGTSVDQGTGIALNPATDDAYVVGVTTSKDLFPTNTYDNFRGASTNSAGKKIKVTSANDVFITVVAPGGVSKTNSAYLGGAGTDQAFGIALNTAGSPIAYIVGQTTSPNLLVTNSVQTNLVQQTLGNVKNSKVTDAFIGRLQFP